MRHSLPLLCLLLILILSATSVARATAGETHALTLFEGDHLRGECVAVSDGILSWRTAYGDIVRVPVSAIRELTCGENWDLQFSDGQNIRGRWGVSNGQITVPSPVFGTLQCSVSHLRAAVQAMSARGLDSGPTTAATSSNEPEPIASPPSNDAPPSSLQTLLRQSSILLRPGEWSVSTEFDYTHDRMLYSPTDTRQLAVKALLQRGITPRIEAALSWPAFATSSKTTAALPTDPTTFTTSKTQKIRAGNPELSASFLLFGEGRSRPECVAVTGLTIPVNSASEGGLFRPRIGLEFLKTSDPGALFAGFGWMRDVGGWDSSPFQPLNRFTYHMGTAIGLNDELAIGVQIQGEYRAEVKSRAGSLLAPSVEPLFGKFWFNFRATQRAFVEMSVMLPMNDDAHASTFGFSYIRRY